MSEKYQKFEIHMVRESDGYRLWKHGTDEAICILETYKEKRSIYFVARNLLPSSYLCGERQGAYHLLLLGIENGELCHRDFGVFYVDQNGEGSVFQKFTGPALSCYTHCLLAIDWGDSTDAEVIYRGESPFFVQEEVENLWEERRKWCSTQSPTKVFSSEIDETRASWYRISDVDTLPKGLEAAKAQVETYKHYILGFHDDACFVGIPGRFLQREQPCRETGMFLLWQPLRGGEVFFDAVSTMTERQQEEIFGYWIAEVDTENERLKPL